VDSRTLSAVKNQKEGTINAWAQRGYVPGRRRVEERRRDFDINAATAGKHA
jgi:hypothetical protein